MMPRFQRGGFKGVSPFFAFQDVITSAMAILIAIIMMLAMYMGGAESGGPTESASRESRTRLKAILDDVIRIRREMQGGTESPADETMDPHLLKVQIQSLRDELAVTVTQGQAKAAQAEAAATKMDGLPSIRAEMDKEKRELEEARAQIKKLEDEASWKRAELEQATKVVQEKESQLLNQRAIRNQLWLIPERSDSTKQPLLAIVSANELTLQRFDLPDKETLHGSRVTRDFSSSVAKYPKLDYYVVFYFKPSGVDHFSRLTSAARDAGYEIGYDVIEESVVINFNSPQ